MRDIISPIAMKIWLPEAVNVAETSNISRVNKDEQAVMVDNDGRVKDIITFPPIVVDHVVNVMGSTNSTKSAINEANAAQKLFNPGT